MPNVSARPDRLRLRARVLQAIRAFLVGRGYVEVETPCRIAAPPNEPHIDAEPSGEAFLRTSPELHLKRLMAEGWERLFEMGPCFRQGERGPRHAPEYTMLEWYRAGADYRDALAETRRLLRAVAADVGCGDHALTRPWQCFEVAERFQTLAGWQPMRAFDADRFDLDMVNLIEPALPRDACAVLIDYPAAAAAMARVAPANPAVAERWELYVGGIELANAFSELTDPREQRRRFDRWAHARRAAGQPVYPADDLFLNALDRGLPACAGVALGVDRLVMALAGADTLDDVRAFGSISSRNPAAERPGP